MAPRLTPSRLEYLLDQAEIQELTDHPSLAALARAHPGHGGAGKLLAALNRHDAGTKVAKSGLELLFNDLCRTHDLPQPKINQRVLVTGMPRFVVVSFGVSVRGRWLRGPARFVRPVRRALMSMYSDAE